MSNLDMSRVTLFDRDKVSIPYKQAFRTWLYPQTFPAEKINPLYRLQPGVWQKEHG